MEIKITITLNPNGTVSINGPLHDKKLCDELLEVAKGLVRDYKPSAIIQPTNGNIKSIKN